MSDRVTAPPAEDRGRRQGMRTPDEVAAMLRLHGLGWGTRRIAAELGCDRETVQRYVAAGGWAPYRRRPGRPRKLAGHGAWLAERFRRHRGNADVVRQELEAELGVRVDLRTVLAAAPARARAWKPARPVTVVVPFGAGSGRQQHQLRPARLD